MNKLYWSKDLRIGIDDYDLLRARFVTLGNRLLRRSEDRLSIDELKIRCKELQEVISTQIKFFERLAQDSQDRNQINKFYRRISELNRFDLLERLEHVGSSVVRREIIGEYLTDWYLQQIVNGDIQISTEIKLAHQHQQSHHGEPESVLSRLKINLSLRKGLPLLFLCLIVPALWAMWFILSASLKQYDQAREINNLVDILRDNTLLVSEIQKERGITAGFMASAKATLTQQMLDIRKRTDLRISSNKKSALKANSRDKTAWLSELRNIEAELSELRNKVDENQVTFHEMIREYSRLVSELLSYADRLSASGDNLDASSNTQALAILVQLQEAAGIERATVSACIAISFCSPSNRQTIVEQMAIQGALAKRVIALSSSREVEVLNRIIDADNLPTYRQILQIVLDTDYELLDSALLTDWWSVSSNRIDSVARIISNRLLQIQSDAIAKKEDTRQLFVIVVLGCFLWLAIGIGVLILLGKQVREPVLRLASAMYSLAEGNYRREIQPNFRVLEINRLIWAYEYIRKRLIVSKVNTTVLDIAQVTRRRLRKQLHQVAIRTSALKKQVNSDALTGIANRRYFFESFKKELKRAEQQESPLCVLMLDIDKFKSINDRFGHGIGDLVIKAVANICSKTLRSEDLVARVGGEEFAILLPDTRLDMGEIIAERIRANVEKFQLRRNESLKLKFTVSVGLSIARDGQWNPDELLAEADKALYLAKNSGRNQVVVFSGLEKQHND